ncbi:MAG: hypothetical protein GY731_02395, partial [Gammaproteobacteria bacterium]|nr:hypothetical protein [Gammaproteobacteria bacterium]
MTQKGPSPARHNPITLLTAALLLSVVVLIGLGWYSYSSYDETKSTRERSLRIEKLHGVIIHLDEVLTMSTRMAATTGDPRWERRYRQFEPQLETAIKESIHLASETHSIEGAIETDAANTKLVDMENSAFDLVRQGRTDEARALLFSEEYEREKRIYAHGMTHFGHPQHHYVRLEGLRSTIIHLDEVLTMSARMAAATGDLRWEMRYHQFEPQLQAAIRESIHLAPETHGKEAAAKTDAANIKLVEMENSAFDLVRQGRNGEAKTLLFSEEYEAQKRIYANGMVAFAAGLSGAAIDSLKQEQEHAFLHIAPAILVIPFLVTGWLIVFLAVRKWEATIRMKNQILAEQAEDMARLNRKLDRQVVKRTAELVRANKQSADLDATNKELSEYTRFVSHDLRAPLRAVRQYANFLKEDLGMALEYEQKEYLDWMMDSIDDADNLVKDLLDLSLIGRETHPVEHINVGEFLKDICGLFATQNIIMEIDDNWPDIRGE